MQFNFILTSVWFLHYVKKSGNIFSNSIIVQKYLKNFHKIEKKFFGHNKIFVCIFYSLWPIYKSCKKFLFLPKFCPILTKNTRINIRFCAKKCFLLLKAFCSKRCSQIFKELLGNSIRQCLDKIFLLFSDGPKAAKIIWQL